MDANPTRSQVKCLGFLKLRSKIPDLEFCATRSISIWLIRASISHPPFLAIARASASPRISGTLCRRYRCQHYPVWIRKVREAISLGFASGVRQASMVQDTIWKGEKSFENVRTPCLIRSLISASFNTVWFLFSSVAPKGSAANLVSQNEGLRSPRFAMSLLPESRR